MGNDYHPTVSKWKQACALAYSWRRAANATSTFRETKLYYHLEPLIDGIAELRAARLTWRARWQVLLTGRIPEDL